MKKTKTFARTFAVEASIFSLCALAVIGCARAPIKSVDQAMRPAKMPRSLPDDLGLADLAGAIQANLDRLKNYGAPLSMMKFGPVEIPKEIYIGELARLIEALKTDPSGELFLNIIRDEFEFYEVYGSEQGWGEVFVTSYFEPIIPGRLKAKKPYTQPIYGTPSDMVNVDMNEFARVFPPLQTYHESAIIQKSRDGRLRGRLMQSDENRQTVVPYYSRQEIDEQKILHGQAPVLCYVDPIDAFFLQIQGSGQIQLPHGQTIRVGYADQNGHPYQPLGKLLFDVIPRAEMTAQKIENYLRTLPMDEVQKLMNFNPSYVFFRKQDSQPLSFFGAEVVAGRTIATDQKYFPKGALAYLEYQRPEFKKADSDEIREFIKSARFVLDQDTGGAIRGPHRVDLFWGSGREAARVSGVMRNSGRLYYILPKKRAL